MESKIKKWGNSNAVRIPTTYLENLGMKENDKILIKEVDDGILISKSNHKTIEERIMNYNGDYICSEFNPLDIKGNEEW